MAMWQRTNNLPAAAVVKRRTIAEALANEIDEV
jgi:hypothetical protein